MGLKNIIDTTNFDTSLAPSFLLLLIWPDN